MAERDPLQVISDIRLDETSIIRRAPEVEHERKVAMYDLIDMNMFHVIGHTGPYHLALRLEDAGKRLSFDVKSEAGDALTEISLPLLPFRRLIKDYFQICESYYDAIKRLSPNQIETIDMARRGLHNEGSDQLTELLSDRISLDKATSRRLFTLICVLHIK